MRRVPSTSSFLKVIFLQTMFNIRTIFLQVLRRGEEVEEEWDEAEDEEITS